MKANSTAARLNIKAWGCSAETQASLASEEPYMRCVKRAMNDMRLNVSIAAD